MNETAEPKKLFEPQKTNFPSDPREWTFMHLINDTNDLHKNFKEEEWTCPDCGIKEMWNPIYFNIVPQARCEPCTEKAIKADKQQKSEVVRESVQDENRSIIPPLYRTTDIQRLPYPQRDQVGQWRPKKNGKGLWIVGDTRMGKTRSACLLLESLIKEEHNLKAFFHGNFNDELVEVIRSERSFRKWKFEITSANILFIDDLFASKLTERVESSLFDILDERISWNRPTLVTTQLTAKEAKSRFHSPKRCEAFFARVKEFFDVVSFEQAEQAELL
jgi:DNA replication protein DnaC